jgi:CRISPR-associated endonuclease/helicase Cas3
LHSEAGGYEPSLGWTGEVAPKTPVPTVDSDAGDRPPASTDGLDSDPRTVLDRWVRLQDHLAHVRDEAGALGRTLGIDGDFEEAVRTAGLWHDVGKAHPEFQRRLLEPLPEQQRPTEAAVWAKSDHRLPFESDRKHFRHELASALAWLTHAEATDERFRSLVAYLVAAHHGKVRLSIRSVPGENAPPEPGRLFARGVWQGDWLLPFEMPGGRALEGVEMDLSCMQFGTGSWLDRMLGLRDDTELGPFRLALLESIVRLADWRASRKEQEGSYDDAG